MPRAEAGAPACGWNHVYLNQVIRALFGFRTRGEPRRLTAADLADTSRRRPFSYLARQPGIGGHQALTAWSRRDILVLSYRQSKDKNTAQHATRPGRFPFWPRPFSG